MVNQSTLTGDAGDTGDNEETQSKHSLSADSDLFNAELSADSELSANPELSMARSELLRAILKPETYPWRVDDETAQTYHTQVETAGQDLELSDEAAASGWQALSAQLDRNFARLQIDPPINLIKTSLAAQIKQKFSDRLPTEMIDRISEKAQQLASESSGRSVLEQMLTCVQEVLSYVAEEDLRVIARPMAMNMRSTPANDFVDATIKSVRTAEWATLSTIEQARLGLAAARYALSEAKSQV
jgi:hypothetical protein